MDAEQVLLIEGMSKELRSAGASFVLEVPRLRLTRGRFYGLVGRSGCGKSTLLDLLAMVSKPTIVSTYRLFVDGASIDLAAIMAANDDATISEVRLRHFGYVLQSGGLFSFLTVRENLSLPFLLSGGSADESQIWRLADQYEMTAHLDKKPAGLSGGQRQRVSILRALCLHPSIILADEPTAAVDENLADRIVAELKRLAASAQVTVVMVSHDTELVAKFADEVVTMKPEVVGAGMTRTVLEMAA